MGVSAMPLTWLQGSPLSNCLRVVRHAPRRGHEAHLEVLLHTSTREAAFLETSMDMECPEPALVPIVQVAAMGRRCAASKSPRLAADGMQVRTASPGKTTDEICDGLGECPATQLQNGEGSRAEGCVIAAGQRRKTTSRDDFISLTCHWIVQIPFVAGIW